eukprot:1236085-Heterocapsa_arctica.AAC.1
MERSELRGESTRAPPSDFRGKTGMAKSKAPLPDSPASFRVEPGRRLEKPNWPALAPKPGNVRTARLKDAAYRKRPFIDGGSAPGGKSTATRRAKNIRVPRSQAQLLAQMPMGMRFAPGAAA